MNAGVMQGGKMKVFSTQPAYGYIKYGKIGYSRLGMTRLLEVRTDFRFFANATLEIESSLDGRNIEPSLTTSYAVSGLNTITIYPNIDQKWHSLKISGEYDLCYLEFRAITGAER